MAIVHYNANYPTKYFPLNNSQFSNVILENENYAIKIYSETSDFNDILPGVSPILKWIYDTRMYLSKEFKNVSYDIDSFLDKISKCIINNFEKAITTANEETLKSNNKNLYELYGSKFSLFDLKDLTIKHHIMPLLFANASFNISTFVMCANFLSIYLIPNKLTPSGYVIATNKMYKNIVYKPINCNIYLTANYDRYCEMYLDDILRPAKKTTRKKDDLSELLDSITTNMLSEYHIIKFCTDPFEVLCNSKNDIKTYISNGKFFKIVMLFAATQRIKHLDYILRNVPKKMFITKIHTTLSNCAASAMWKTKLKEAAMCKEYIYKHLTRGKYKPMIIGCEFLQCLSVACYVFKNTPTYKVPKMFDIKYVENTNLEELCEIYNKYDWVASAECLSEFDSKGGNDSVSKICEHFKISSFPYDWYMVVVRNVLGKLLSVHMSDATDKYNVLKSPVQKQKILKDFVSFKANKFLLPDEEEKTISEDEVETSSDSPKVIKRSKSKKKSKTTTTTTDDDDLIKLVCPVMSFEKKQSNWYNLINGTTTKLPYPQ